MGSGVVAHVSADGRLPGAVAMLVLFAICCAGAARFLSRPASTLRVVMLVIAGQTFIHGVLTAMVGHRGDPPVVRSQPVSAPLLAATPPEPALPAAGGHRVGSLADLAQVGRPAAPPVQLSIPAPLQHLIADFTGPHAVMAIAHLLAAVALGCWLAHGERLLWTALSVTASALLDLGATARSRARALGSLTMHVLRTAARRLTPAARRRRVPDAVEAARNLRLAVETGLRGPPPATAG